jgi:hypothetical protein
MNVDMATKSEIVAISPSDIVVIVDVSGRRYRQNVFFRHIHLQNGIRATGPRPILDLPRPHRPLTPLLRRLT